MNQNAGQFIDFRARLHASFDQRANATMELIDALASSTQATSAVQVSLSSLFRRKYSSLHDAVDNFFVPACQEKANEERDEHQRELMRIVAPLCPKPSSREFYLFALDATPQSRQFSDTLEDRGFVYNPNPIIGNKPITIGHSYSTLVALLEKDSDNAPPWVLPLSTRRVPIDQKATDIGAFQVKTLLGDKELPFGGELSVLAADTAYSAVTFLNQQSGNKNQITIVRVRGDRTFYSTPVQDDSPRGKGHPTWFGSAFRMKDPSTWKTPDETVYTTYTTKKGRLCHVEIQAWHNMLMTGKKDIPMHKHPFTLMHITVRDDNGKAVYKRPMWVIIYGERRHEITLIEAWEAYRQRFDIEHFFRFGKNRLLMDSYQTPVVEHEENWWEIAGLSYALLWAAATIARKNLRPWERYLPVAKDKEADLPSPSMVQRDMERIIPQFGTPAAPPKPRGKSPGRQKGQSPGRRNRHPVIKKGGASQQKAVRAP